MPPKNKEAPHGNDYKSLGWAVLAAFVIGFAVLVIVGRFYVNEHSERVRFVTVNALSWCVLLAILVQTYIYRRQWAVMDRQLTKTDQMIAAMQGQLSVMRDAWLVGESAYMGIDNVILDRLTPNDNLIATLVTLNGGRTPAWTVHVHVNFVIVPPEMNPPQVNISFSGGRGFSFIPPGGGMRHTQVMFEGTVTTEHVAAVKAGTMDLYLVGKIMYRDFTGEQRERRFRVQYLAQDGRFADDSDYED